MGSSKVDVNGNDDEDDDEEEEEEEEENAAGTCCWIFAGLMRAWYGADDDKVEEEEEEEDEDANSFCPEAAIGVCRDESIGSSSFRARRFWGTFRTFETRMVSVPESAPDEGVDGFKETAEEGTILFLSPRSSESLYWGMGSSRSSFAYVDSEIEKPEE